MTTIRFASLAGLLFVTTSNSLATTPCPRYSYKKDSADGKFVFVMIPPITMAEDLGPWNEETKNEISNIRKRYARSGLYLNDDSRDPVWVADWYSYGVEVLSHGVRRTDADGSSIVYDLASGEIISVSHPNDFNWRTVAIASVAWLVFCVALIVARRRRTVIWPLKVP